MNKDIFKQFNLPSYLKGKSFAQASKMIEKRFEGRTDKESLETKRELMTRLRDAQEYVKSMNNPQQPQANNNPSAPQMGMNPQMQQIAQMQQQQQSIPNQQMNPTQDYFLGGLLGMFGGQGGGAGLSGALGLATTALGAGQQIFGKTGIDTSGATAVSGKGESELGGAANGALSGAQAGMALGPMGAIGGALIGGVGGLFGSKKRNDALDEARKNNSWAQANEFRNRFDSGGYTNQYDGITNPFSWLDIANTAKGVFDNALNNIPNQGIGTPESMGEIDYFNTESNANIEELLRRPYQTKIQGQTVNDTGYKVPVNSTPKANLRDKEKTIEGMTAGFSEGFGNKFGITNPDISQELQQRTDMSNRGAAGLPKTNLGGLPELLRYAPAAMNAYQLSQLKKPKQESLDRLGNKYQRQLTDEEALQNLVREGTSNVRDSIVSSSGGSGSTARANLLASQLQGTKALSDSYMRGAEANRAENRAAQQFDLGVDQFNIGQSNQENVINAQNQGNYDTQKSKLLAALGDNLGGIGREELFKRYPELMGSLYNWRGKYNKNNAT